MTHRTCCAVGMLIGCAGVAAGQTILNPYEIKQSDYADADLSIMPQVGVHPSYAVVFGSHRILLYDKASTLTLLDSRQ